MITLAHLRINLLALAAVTLSHPQLAVQTAVTGVQVDAHLDPARSTDHHSPSEAQPPAILWLQPLGGQVLAPLPKRTYSLTQKNKMFSPHLLVVPVGSVVSFPNKDPFFHNVFSLFDGKRFDLGLYESGTTKEITFSREGVSYIFCNIHSEMSAVIVALATPIYSVANRQGVFHLDAVPPGSYAVHVWIEGQTQADMDRLVHTIQLDVTTNLGGIAYKRAPQLPQHTNKFNEPYDNSKPSPY